MKTGLDVHHVGVKINFIYHTYGPAFLLGSKQALHLSQVIAAQDSNFFIVSKFYFNKMRPCRFCSLFVFHRRLSTWKPQLTYFTGGIQNFLFELMLDKVIK